MRKRGYIGKLATLEFAKLGRLPGRSNDRRVREPTVSLKRRILSLALVGAVGFLLYLAVSINLSSYSSNTLQSIQDVGYPVQASLIKAQSKLETIQSKLQMSMLTSDDELVITTAVHAEEFRSSLFDVSRLNTSLSDSLNSIQEKFDLYYLSSSTFAMELHGASNSLERFNERKKSNRIVFSELKGELQVILDDHNKRLHSTISEANKLHKISIYLGYSAGIGGALLVLVLTWFTANNIARRISEMVTSLKNIANGESDLSVRMKVTGKDEMTDLAYWFNIFVARIESVTKQTTDEIHRIAYTDNLSSLPNRRLLLHCIHSEAERCKIDENRSVVGMFLDLDNFKPINDQLGHDAGDELIRQVAHRLQNIVLSDDVPKDGLFDSMSRGEHPVVARIGGDEFFVLVPGAAADDAKTLAENIINGILEPYSISGAECHIGVSIGISLYPDDASDTANIMDKADLAMYEAKNAGKNTYRFYSKSITDAAKEKAMLENALRDCIARNELELFFQPKFDMHNGHYEGAEVLLRWNSEHFGLMTPKDFMPYSEKSGQMLKIDQWVLSESCRYIKHWTERGIDPKRLAVNISPHLARNKNCVEIVDNIMAEHDLSGTQLELEVTEPPGIHGMQDVTPNLRVLRQRGIRIAMDDFGLGQSSMTVLIDKEIDALKLDRSLIKDIENNERTKIIVKSIIEMAKSLRLSSIAEGVENSSQLQQLREMGCDTAQGYYFAKPMTATELESFMSEPANLLVKRVS